MMQVQSFWQPRALTQLIQLECQIEHAVRLIFQYISDRVVGNRQADLRGTNRWPAMCYTDLEGYAIYVRMLE